MKYLYTSPDFIGYRPNFPATASQPKGGVSTKMASIRSALGCKIVTQVDDIQGTPDLIIEPLGIKAPRNVPEEIHHNGWEHLREIEMGRAAGLTEYEGNKILLCSELEVLRWPEELRQYVLQAVGDSVYASCYYQSSLFNSIGIDSKVIYEPVNEKMFYPTHKRLKTVVAIGSVKHIKGISHIIDIFKALEGTGFQRIYIGDIQSWGAVVSNPQEIQTDFQHYEELMKVCDEYYPTSPATFVAKTLSECEFFLNFAYHETCCRTAMEAILSGCGVIGGQHPLWNEYPVIAQVKTATDAINVMEKNTGAVDINNLRDWGVQNFGLPRFRQQIEDAFNDRSSR